MCHQVSRTLFADELAGRATRERERERERESRVVACKSTSSVCTVPARVSELRVFEVIRAETDAMPGTHESLSLETNARVLRQMSHADKPISSKSESSATE